MNGGGPAGAALRAVVEEADPSTLPLGSLPLEPNRSWTPPKSSGEAPDALLEETSKEGIQTPVPRAREKHQPELPSRAESLEAWMGPTIPNDQN